jgi:hypothetical protein
MLDAHGFVFSSFEAPEGFLQEALSTPKPSEAVKRFFSSWLAAFGCPTDRLRFVYEDIHPGRSHELHTHLVPAAYQVVAWFPAGSFEGRDFLYGRLAEAASGGLLDSVQRFSPRLGDLCFMKTNDLGFVHGVSPLTRGSWVRTLIIDVNNPAEQGEHVTVTAGGVRPI